METKEFEFSLGELITEFNNSKSVVLYQLIKDGIITEDQAKEYDEKWQIIIVKQGWFKRWMKAFSNGKSDEYVYKFVKFEY